MITKRSRRIRKYRKEAEKMQRKCEREVQTARNNKQPAEVIQSLEQGWVWEMSAYWDLEAAEHSEFWLRRASKNHIPRPKYDDNDCWTESKWIGGRHLTSQGVSKIRQAWKNEIQWKFTVGSSLFSIFFGLGGLTVAIIALAK